MFHNGSKKKVWKSDMDGIIDVKNKDIKKAIDGLMQVTFFRIPNEYFNDFWSLAVWFNMLFFSCKRHLMVESR